MSSPASLTPDRIRLAYQTARGALLDERNADGYWTGELSTSALSTATAVMALEMVRRHGAADGDRIESLIQGGLRWLAEHQNDDGGWGDTVKSISNISTTMLARASFHAAGGRGTVSCRLGNLARQKTAKIGRSTSKTGKLDHDPAGSDAEFSSTVTSAQQYIDRTGGVPAVLKRYGKDRTFSIPILTHCALAGLVDWKTVLSLPFELACLPARFYKTVRLPVVSYALPALIAIGQCRYAHRPPRNPVVWLIRWLSLRPSLRVLDRIQPENGGFLEATPLTSFVTMSLASIGQAGHPVTRRGVDFIIRSVRPDGSWPIDTNLATWVTTLSVNALGDDLPESGRAAIRAWLLGQQYTEMHPYTDADPGGWAWTDLPGGVPDADDTPGAILALLQLARRDNPPSDQGDFAQSGRPRPSRAVPASPDQNVADGPDTTAGSLRNGIRWLLDLQNRDGGWPTFCRGWGKLPFDRSAPDISAHVLRAMEEWLARSPDTRSPDIGPERQSAGQVRTAIETGFAYLKRVQRDDGSWLPLWFGNQYAQDDENPAYGTARVLAAFRDAGHMDTPAAYRGIEWLVKNQNADGGWGGVRGIPSTIEETALAAEILLSYRPDSGAACRAVAWLVERVEQNSYRETSPIGFYFAKLWYFEAMYPLTFLVAALRRAHQSADKLCPSSDLPVNPSPQPNSVSSS